MTFPAEPPTPRSRPRLTWTDTSGAHSVELDGTVAAGSAPRAELVVADRAVSRLHVELSPREDGLWVRDLGSRNGTYVDSVKVERARVPSGAAIRLGTTELRVSYETPRAPELLWSETHFHGLVARSAAMREVFAQVAALATTNKPVVLLGEPGTGKEALARALHDRSEHRERPFVVVDCAALPADAAPAAERLEEALGLAEGGTLLLDDPAELSVALQRELVPPIAAEAFRTLVTTSRDLRDLVNLGAFREDLYFRLAGGTVVVPPLRQRLVDLDILLAHFLGDHAGLVSQDLVADLSRLPWPGNVRELALFVESLRGDAAAPSLRRQWADIDAPDSGTAEIPVLPDPGESGGRPTPSSPPFAGGAPASGPGGQTLLPPGLEPWFEIGFKEFREKWIELGEREYLRRLMLRTHRSSSTAAREAGLERTYLYRLIKRHGV